MGTLSGTGGYPFPPQPPGGGGGSITFTKVNRDGTKEKREESSMDKNIPAGWAVLDIVNLGLSAITVNGKDVIPGGRWNSQDVIDWPAQKQEFGPAVTILANSQPFAYHVIYPTSSAVDVGTI
jgi:hypothetical protein